MAKQIRLWGSKFMTIKESIVRLYSLLGCEGEEIKIGKRDAEALRIAISSLELNEKQIDAFKTQMWDEKETR